MEPSGLTMTARRSRFRVFWADFAVERIGGGFELRQHFMDFPDFPGDFLIAVRAHIRKHAKHRGIQPPVFTDGRFPKDQVAAHKCGGHPENGLPVVSLPDQLFAAVHHDGPGMGADVV